MELISTVRGCIPHMTRAEQKVASVFLDNPESFAFFTLDKISRMIDTSTTTTLRFCRTLGFDGYKEFQAAVQHELKLKATLPEKLLNASRGVSDNALLEEVIEQGVQNIYRTFHEIPGENLTKAIQLLSSASRLFVCGTRESYALTHYAYTRAITVRSNVFILNAINDGMVESILSLGPDDVCLFFAFHRYSSLSLRLLPLIRKQGARVILITSSPTDTVEQFADLIFPCQLDIGSIKNSSLAPICLLDYFCAGISCASEQDLMLRMNSIEDLLRTSGVV